MNQKKRNVTPLPEITNYIIRLNANTKSTLTINNNRLTESYMIQLYYYYYIF